MSSTTLWHLEAGLSLYLFDLTWPLSPCRECALESFISCLHHRLPLQHLFSIQSPMSELTSLFRFNTNWFGPMRQPSQFISAAYFGLAVYPYTCIIISHKQWKHETAEGTNAIQGNKARAEWKDPRQWRSRLASIRKQQAEPFCSCVRCVCLFWSKYVCVKECMQAEDVSIRKTWREHKLPKMSLTLRCTWVKPAHNASSPFF